MTRNEYFQANPKATFDDYKAYLAVVITLTQQLGKVPTESQIELEQLVKQRDEALEHYEYCLEHYGETDEDTIQAECDYNTLDSIVSHTPVEETV